MNCKGRGYTLLGFIFVGAFIGVLLVTSVVMSNRHRRVPCYGGGVCHTGSISTLVCYGDAGLCTVGSTVRGY